VSSRLLGQGPSGERARPRIGITTTAGGPQFPRVQRYALAVMAVGGDPVWLEPFLILGARTPEESLTDVDALLLSGGDDIDPRYYGELVVPEARVQIDSQRDAAELLVTRAALAAGLPILGICRGIQTLNVAAGGSLYQDLSLGNFDAAMHQQKGSGKADWDPAHPIAVAAGSRTADILGGERAEVNSFHHQAVKAVAPGFVVTARAPDGVIEAIEHPARPFVVGVQWHPERMADHQAPQRRLFETLVEAARAPA